MSLVLSREPSLSVKAHQIQAEMATKPIQDSPSFTPQVLTGQDNYNQWARDFKLVAKSEGLWSFYDGTEPVVEKPNRADYGIPFRHKREVGAPWAPATAPHCTETNIVLYKLDMDEWRENDKRVGSAQLLLHHWVDPSIRRNLEKYGDPQQAWDYLKATYKIPNGRALHIALGKMDRLTFEDCSDTQDYLNRLELVRFEIRDANGRYDDAQLISKIHGDLPSEYDELIAKYYVRSENLNLRKFSSELLAFESTLEQSAEKRT